MDVSVVDAAGPAQTQQSENYLLRWKEHLGECSQCRNRYTLEYMSRASERDENILRRRMLMIGLQPTDAVYKWLPNCVCFHDMLVYIFTELSAADCPCYLAALRRAVLGEFGRQEILSALFAVTCERNTPSGLALFDAVVIQWFIDLYITLAAPAIPFLVPTVFSYALFDNSVWREAQRRTSNTVTPLDLCLWNIIYRYPLANSIRVPSGYFSFPACDENNPPKLVKNKVGSVLVRRVRMFSPMLFLYAVALPSGGGNSFLELLPADLCSALLVRFIDGATLVTNPNTGTPNYYDPLIPPRLWDPRYAKCVVPGLSPQ